MDRDTRKQFHEVLIIVGLFIFFTLYCGAGYVLYHFISKYW